MGESFGRGELVKGLKFANVAQTSNFLFCRILFFHTCMCERTSEFPFNYKPTEECLYKLAFSDL
jgi:hypothetical protein